MESWSRSTRPGLDRTRAQVGVACSHYANETGREPLKSHGLCFYSVMENRCYKKISNMASVLGSAMLSFKLTG